VRLEGSVGPSFRSETYMEVGGSADNQPTQGAEDTSSPALPIQAPSSPIQAPSLPIQAPASPIQAPTLPNQAKPRGKQGEKPPGSSQTYAKIVGNSVPSKGSDARRPSPRAAPYKATPSAAIVNWREDNMVCPLCPNFSPPNKLGFVTHWLARHTCGVPMVVCRKGDYSIPLDRAKKGCKSHWTHCHGGEPLTHSSFRNVVVGNTPSVPTRGLRLAPDLRDDLSSRLAAMRARGPFSVTPSHTGHYGPRETAATPNSQPSQAPFRPAAASPGFQPNQVSVVRRAVEATVASDRRPTQARRVRFVDEVVAPLQWQPSQAPMMESYQTPQAPPRQPSADIAVLAPQRQQAVELFREPERAPQRQSSPASLMIPRQVRTPPGFPAPAQVPQSSQDGSALLAPARAATQASRTKSAVEGTLERLSQGTTSMADLAALAAAQVKESLDLTFWDGHLQGFNSAAQELKELRNRVEVVERENRFLNALVRDYNNIQK
jgi:hypothetical protein